MSILFHNCTYSVTEKLFHKLDFIRDKTILIIFISFDCCYRCAFSFFFSGYNKNVQVFTEYQIF